MIDGKSSKFFHHVDSKEKDLKNEKKKNQNCFFSSKTFFIKNIWYCLFFFLSQLESGHQTLLHHLDVSFCIKSPN